MILPHELVSLVLQHHIGFIMKGDFQQLIIIGVTLGGVCVNTVLVSVGRKGDSVWAVLICDEMSGRTRRKGNRGHDQSWTQT